MTSWPKSQEKSLLGQLRLLVSRVPAPSVCYNPITMTPPALLESALKLTPSERILLAEQIWDSLARVKRTGPRGSTWSDVKARLKKRRA